MKDYVKFVEMHRECDKTVLSCNTYVYCNVKKLKEDIKEFTKNSLTKFVVYGECKYFLRGNRIKREELSFNEVISIYGIERKSYLTF